MNAVCAVALRGRVAVVGAPASELGNVATEAGLLESEVQCITRMMVVGAALKKRRSGALAREDPAAPRPQVEAEDSFLAVLAHSC